MKRLVTFVLFIVIAATGSYFLFKKNTIKGKEDIIAGVSLHSTETIVPSFDAQQVMKRVKNFELTLKNYAIKNKCNKQYGFLIDMRIPSYRNRFFVYDMKKDSVIDAGLVAHGTGSQPRNRNDDLLFSNVAESRCSSLGKYKISNSYTGIYGFSYRLIGLDSTNNNALKRAIVLHGHSCVPDLEDTQYGWPICFSYGCPMVSTNYLKRLKGYITKQGKEPILMWIFY